MKKILKYLAIPIFLSFVATLPFMVTAQALTKQITVAAWGDNYGTPVSDKEKDKDTSNGKSDTKGDDWSGGGKKDDWGGYGGKGTSSKDEGKGSDWDSSSDKHKGDDWGGYGGHNKDDKWDNGGKKDDWGSHGKGGNWDSWGKGGDKYEHHGKYCKTVTFKKWVCKKDCYFKHGEYFCEPKCGWYEKTKYKCYD